MNRVREWKTIQLGLQGYKHLVLGQRKALQVGGTAYTKAWSMQELEHKSLEEKVVASEPRAMS